MPLAMQGDKLLPRREHVVGGGTCPRTPDGGCGDRLLDASCNLGQAPPAKLGHHALRVGCAAVGENVDESGLYLRGLGMAELDAGELLEMIMQEPGVIDDGLQNKGFAAGDGGTMAAVD